jgi:hypothetical protein
LFSNLPFTLFFHLGPMLHMLGEYVTCYLTCYEIIGTCYLACFMPLGTHQMGGYECKIWQGENDEVEGSVLFLCEIYPCRMHEYANTQNNNSNATAYKRVYKAGITCIYLLSVWHGMCIQPQNKNLFRIHFSYCLCSCLLHSGWIPSDWILFPVTICMEIESSIIWFPYSFCLMYRLHS